MAAILIDCIDEMVPDQSFSLTNTAHGQQSDSGLVLSSIRAKTNQIDTIARFSQQVYGSDINTTLKKYLIDFKIKIGLARVLVECF